MLNINDVVEALAGMIGEYFPDETVYQNRIPTDFVRPSFLVEAGAIQMSDASSECVDINAQFVVTTFVETDEYYNSHIPELRRRMMAVQELLAVGYLKVGGRYLHISGNMGEPFFDYAEIKLTLSYQDDRPGGEDWPLMGEVNVNMKGES